MSIYQLAKIRLNRPMDINDIRRANLALLLEEFGTAAALAKAAGTDPAYLSQIKSTKTKREMGDDLARRLEKAASKQRGWMDHTHESSSGRGKSPSAPKSKDNPNANTYIREPIDKDRLEECFLYVMKGVFRNKKAISTESLTDILMSALTVAVEKYNDQMDGVHFHGAESKRTAKRKSG